MFHYCTRCVMPNTRPDTFFNDEGVCDACESSDLKEKIDWVAREKEFQAVVKKARRKDRSKYDCIVPVSGGKDSHYQAYMAKKYGLNILMFNFEPTVRTELGKLNLENIRQFGDLIEMKKSHRTHRIMALEGFRRVGDNEWPSHAAIFSYAVRLAIAFDIPLILWGENSQLEYGGPKAARMKKILDRKWLEEFCLIGLRVEDMIGPATGLTKENVIPWLYPSDDELRKAKIQGLFLGYYFKWDYRVHTPLMQTMGFRLKEDGPVEGTFLNIENLDEEMQALHDHLKFVKFGFGRSTDHACIDIRNGRMTREEGVKMVNQFDGKFPKRSAELFIKYTGISREEFDRVVDSFTDKAIFETDGNGNLKRDENGDLIKKYQDYSIEAQTQSR